MQEKELYATTKWYLYLVFKPIPIFENQWNYITKLKKENNITTENDAQKTLDKIQCYC